MATATETLALRLVRALYDATEATPQAWRSLAGLGKGSESADAVQYAVDRGWLLIEGGHSVRLTDAGRRRAQV